MDQVDPNDRKGKIFFITSIIPMYIVFNNHLLAIYAARNQKIRDDWVKAMEARIIKEKLDECYRTEGVNHCKFFLFYSSKTNY